MLNATWTGITVAVGEPFGGEDSFNLWSLLNPGGSCAKPKGQQLNSRDELLMTSYLHTTKVWLVVDSLCQFGLSHLIVYIL